MPAGRSTELVIASNKDLPVLSRVRIGTAPIDERKRRFQELLVAKYSCIGLPRTCGRYCNHVLSYRYSTYFTNFLRPASFLSSALFQLHRKMASALITSLAFAQLSLGGAVPYSALFGRGSPESCTNMQLSCHNTTAVQDLCCFNAPGGQLLQTQFWDTDPSTGPSDSWTIHGLWSINDL